MNLEIRKMKPEDGSRIIEIFQQGINGGNATFDSTAPTWEVWDMNHFSNCRFVIEDENEHILGWCALKPISNRDCYSGVAEVSIYIADEIQGKGFGTLLLKKLILDSEENGFWTLQAGIFPENNASISLHQKQGFRIVGTRDKIGKMNGEWRDVVLLERRSRIAGI